MSLEKSEGVILKSFNWSESSRTVHLFTRDFGRIALIDKGGRKLTSKRGRLLPFSRLEITFYSSKKETSGYISDVGLVETFSFESEGSLGRLAYGSAACEVLFLLLPEDEAQTSLYAYFVNYLKLCAASPRRSLPGLFVTFLLRVMSQLGYQPSIGFCSGCGKESKPGKEEILFSPERGGVVCRACQLAGDYYIPLSADRARMLSALQVASLNEAVELPIGYEDATYVLELLAKFLKYHSGLVSDLKSLQFLEKLKKTDLNG